MSNGKKVITLRKWIVEHIIYNDGTTELKRTNDGFNSFELMGLLELSKDDIINQIKGNVKPDIIKRKVKLNNEQR
jgi:hypothetical protein